MDMRRPRRAATAKIGLQRGPPRAGWSAVLDNASVWIKIHRPGGNLRPAAGVLSRPKSVELA
jgi:hypothetical protein